LSWFRSRKIVEEAFLKRKDAHPSGAIVRFEESCAWKSHIFDLEKKYSLENEVKYVLFPDTTSHGHRVQCVPVDSSSFVNRKSLKKEWRGIRDTELAKVSGIEDAVFCHANGFIGGAKSYESALKMAVLSLEAEE